MKIFIVATASISIHPAHGLSSASRGGAFGSLRKSLSHNCVARESNDVFTRSNGEEPSSNGKMERLNRGASSFTRLLQASNDPLRLPSRSSPIFPASNHLNCASLQFGAQTHGSGTGGVRRNVARRHPEGFCPTLLPPVSNSQPAYLWVML